METKREWANGGDDTKKRWGRTFDGIEVKIPVK
jgi:hypothetical protein